MKPKQNELEALQKQIELWAKGYGLDFFETIFELIDAKHLNEIAAYGGFPTRYPHWRFGMIYDSLSKGYEYGLQKIYELVINNDPCYAYLMNSNTLVDQKIVIAHVYGHCDFFKNNQFFKHTHRKMIDEMANHASRIRQYGELYGIDEVETFIDEFLTPELCEKLKLFVYAYNKRNGTYEIVDRDTKKVKDKLLFSLTNFGQPMISVTEDNFEGKGVLLLTHTHYGVDLKLLEAKETLERVQKIWKQTVCLETIINGERRLLIYDGKEHREKSL